MIQPGINPLVRDAMQRAGETAPENGVVSLSNGAAISCAATPQEDAYDYAKELAQTRAYGWLERYQRDFMDQKKADACRKAFAALKSAISTLNTFPK